MVSLFDKIHEMKKNPQAFVGKLVRGTFYSGLVEVLNVISQNDTVQLMYKSVANPNDVDIKVFYPDQLKEVEIIDQDFGGNSRLFFLSIMGYIIKNNYQADPYFAVGISNIDPLPHQLDAVYNYILPRGRLRFMIADDPGAGKTIMAGLVIKEYLSRGLAEKILIVCPGGLTEQWEMELRQKFSEDFKWVHRGIFNTYKHQNIWDDYPKAIASIDFLKQKDIIGSMENATWDLIIVDEAHKFAGRVNKDVFEPNKRYRLGRVICSQALNVLFLTATPHKGDLQVYRMLLALLEPEIFGDEFVYYAPDVDKQVLELESSGMPVFLRRLKEMMVDLDGNPIFKKRRSDTITWTISDLETKLYRAVSKYVTENFNKALKNKKTAVAFALKIMQRRLLSSSHAIYNTLGNRAARLQEILDNEDYKTSEEELSKMEREYRTKLELEWEDLTESERNKIETKLLQLSMAKNPKELKEEIDLLQELQDFAGELKATPDQETKLWELKKLLEKNLKDPDEKILIFTEFTDTLKFLEQWVNNWGYSVTIIHGGMNKDTRIDARKEFQMDKQVLIATEAAGEGINLQFCHLLINYDIPWVPTRLEQRLGRIHRYGQKKECYFMNLVSDRASDGKPIAEGDVLASLLKKIETISESLGEDRVFDVIGREIFEDLSLDQAFSKIINDSDGFFEIKRQIESEELRDKIKETLENARSNMMVNLDAIKEKTKTSEDTRLWPEYIEDFVRKALIHLDGRITNTGTIFTPKKLQEYTHAVTSRYKNITFKKPKTSIFEETEYEYISLGHPLLDSFIKYYLDLAEIDMRRGAIFLDEQGFDAGLLWFIEQSIADGSNRLVGKRIGVLFQPFDNDLNPLEPQSVPPLKLCDLKPINKHLEIKEKFDFSKEQNKVLEFYQKSEGKVFFESIKERNDSFCEIQAEATENAHDLQRGYLIQRISSIRNQLKKANLDDKRREKLKRKKSRAEKQRDVLQQRYDNFKETLKIRQTINPNPPQIIGLTLILPGDQKGGYDQEFIFEQGTREKIIRQLVDKQKVDAAAMKVVQDYEEKCGRIPVDVKDINCGYDIESTDPANSNATRRIEVKGHTEAGTTFITNNEFKMGLRFANNYWLYVVENALTNPKLRVIQNPALKLFDDVKEIQRTTYIIPQEAIEEKSEIIPL